MTLALLLALAMVTQPYPGQAASEVDKINKQLEQLQKELEQTTRQKKNAEKNVQALTNQKKATKEEIQALMAEIAAAGKKLAETQQQIEDTEANLQKTGEELEAAIQLEASTSEKLDTRVRLMYTNGAVSYMDVLLSSTSFADFLSRFDEMQSVTVQTRDLLEDQKTLRAQVEEKKAQVEQELADVKTLYEQMAAEKADLESKENAKEEMMKQLDEKIEETEDISEESEKLLIDLAKKIAKAQAELKKIKTYYKGGKLAVPLKSDYRVSSEFGYRIHPITHKKKLHAGMDMAAPAGTPIYAAESGVVIVAQWWSGYGNCVIIDHGGGLWTLYGHIKNGGILVKKGDTVKRGEKIALVGSTGESTGNHLHFEVRKDSEPVDPVPYIK